MNNYQYHIKRIEKHSDLGIVNQLLETEKWKVAREESNEFGETVYVMHKVK